MNGLLRYARQTALLATTSVAGLSAYKHGHEYVVDKKEKDHSSTTSYNSANVSFPSSTRTSCEPCKTNASSKGEVHVRVPSSKPGTKLLFLGSGSSTGCPKPVCAITFPESNELRNKNPMVKLQKDLEAKCKISRIANVGDPRFNKNYRNNPSLLISHRNNDSDVSVSDQDNSAHEHEKELKNVIIDVGKTFREGALRWMPHHGIYHLDSIVLTHEHADAFLGLDDLRGFQIARHMISSDGTTSGVPNMSLPVYLSPKCFETIKQAFGYLVPKELTEQVKSINTKKGGPKVVRHVAALDFQKVQHFKPFFAAGLKMIPLPVIHGEDFICNGYAFSVKGDMGRTVNVLYLSDISRMLPETEQFILEKLPPTDILVVDSLLYERDHSVHYSLDQALDLVERLGPKKTYLVGMNCDDFPEHDEANIVIRSRNPTVELAHDGLVVEL